MDTGKLCGDWLCAQLSPTPGTLQQMGSGLLQGASGDRTLAFCTPKVTMVAVCHEAGCTCSQLSSTSSTACCTACPSSPPAATDVRGMTIAAAAALHNREPPLSQHYTLSSTSCRIPLASLCCSSFTCQAWYPAMCIDNLDPEKPNKFQLLGK